MAVACCIVLLIRYVLILTSVSAYGNVEAFITHRVDFFASLDLLLSSRRHDMCVHLLLSSFSCNLVILLRSLCCLLKFFLPLANLVLLSFFHQLFRCQCHGLGIGSWRCCRWSCRI